MNRAVANEVMKCIPATMKKAGQIIKIGSDIKLFGSYKNYFSFHFLSKRKERAYIKHSSETFCL